MRHVAGTQVPVFAACMNRKEKVRRDARFFQHEKEIMELEAGPEDGGSGEQTGMNDKGDWKYEELH